MIPKKVRKIISIMIAVALVMAVIPAVAFADEVNTLFGNGDETVASTGDATESEEGEQEAAAIGQDENAPQNDETIATDETGAENVDDSQSGEVAQTGTDLDIKLMRNRGNAGGNLNALNNTNNDMWDFSLDTTNCVETEDGMPVYYAGFNTLAPRCIVRYDGYDAPTDKYRVKYADSQGNDLQSQPTTAGTYYITLEVNTGGGDSGWESRSGPYKIKNSDVDVSKFAVTIDVSNCDTTHMINTGRDTCYDYYKYDEGQKMPSVSATYDGSSTLPTGYRLHSYDGVYEDGVVLKVAYIQKKDGSWTEIGSTNTSEFYSLIDGPEMTVVFHKNLPDDSREDYRYPRKGRKLNKNLIPDYIKASDPSAPACYNFGGWYTSASCDGTAFDTDNTIITDNLDLYAKWTRNHKSSLTHSVKVPATCVDAGTEEYWYCDSCKTYFSDSEGKNKLDSIDIPIDDTAHDWEPVQYNWSSDNSSVTAIRTCKNDISHIETETVQTTKTVTKEATETTPGDVIYSAEFSNVAFEKQTKYMEIPAKGKSEQPKSDESESGESKSQEPEKKEVVDDDAYYINASGDKITWTVGSNETINIKFERSEDNASTSKHFLGIEVDGKATSKDLYDTEDGSIIIKLKPALLESLGEGEHTLTALFDDGSASAKFTIIKATKEVKNEKKTTSKNAKTGDSSPIKFVIILMIISALAIAGTLIIKKKRH